jgi:hypothetical protein
MARPKQILTERETKLIIALYELGKTDEEIANLLQMSRTTFLYVLKTNGLIDTIKKAKGIADDKVEVALYSDALTHNNTTAKIFWLCNRRPDRWKNIQKIEGRVESKDFQIEIVRVRDSEQEKKEQS